MHDGPNVQQIKKVHILKDDSSVVHSGAEETRPNQRFSVAFPLIGRFLRNLCYKATNQDVSRVSAPRYAY